MRLVGRVCIFAVCSSLAVSAGTVNFRSGDGVNEWNSVTSTNVLLTANPLWDTDPRSGKWVSFINTGDKGTFIENDLTAPFARFTEEFILPDVGGEYAGNIDIWADDTAAVYLNGVLIQAANFVVGEHCAAGSVGCLPGMSGHHYLFGPLLKVGANTLEVDVYQVGGDTSGVLYSGSFVDAPEPATFGLLGIGLAALGIFRSRRS